MAVTDKVEFMVSYSRRSSRLRPQDGDLTGPMFEPPTAEAQPLGN
jgi:hypothetical protein